MVPPQAELQLEQLDSENSWYCPKCKAHVAASKKLDLWELPECLVVHLKRFTHGRLSAKLDTAVEYPLQGLDLSPYVLKRQVGEWYHYRERVISRWWSSG